MRKLNNIPFWTLVNCFLSGILVRVGFLIVIISSIFLIVFVPNIDSQAEKYEKEKVILKNGILTQIIETNLIVNNQRIFQYNYIFNYNGNEKKGSSYAFIQNVNVQDSVSLEIIANNSDISRIKGMANGAFSSTFLYIFPAILIFGLILILYSIYRKLILIKVLKNGFEIVSSELVSEIKFSSPFRRKSNQFYKLDYKYSINNRVLRKVVFVQLSVFQLSRVRYSGILVGADSNDNGFIYELLPSGLKEIINK